MLRIFASPIRNIMCKSVLFQTNESVARFRVFCSLTYSLFSVVLAIVDSQTTVLVYGIFRWRLQINNRFTVF